MQQQNLYSNVVIKYYSIKKAIFKALGANFRSAASFFIYLFLLLLLLLLLLL